MTEMRDWEKLLTGLADAFTTDGIIGKKLYQVNQKEKAYGEYVEHTWRGHSIISHAFQEFYIETLQTAATVWQETNQEPTPPTYAETFMWHLANFRSLRAVDILFHNGYPMDGFARLRHLKESAVFLAAILGGITSWTEIKGFEGVPSRKRFTPEDVRRIQAKRMKEERRVLNAIVRKESGLSEKQKDELRIWADFFHQEVHGAQLTQFLEHGPAMRGEDTTSVAPKPREDSCAMFMNRFSEVAWMLHRTLPILQLSNRTFDETWNQKWFLLDQNFKKNEECLQDMGKKIAGVFLEFIEIKFPFGPHFTFDAHVRSEGHSQ